MPKQTIITRRKIMALLVGLVVFASVFGFAAMLDINAATLGAGNAEVASCDPDGISTSFTQTYDGSSKEYLVSEIAVNEIAKQCSGETIQVTLYNADGKPLGPEVTAVITDVPTQRFPVGSAIPASAVSGIAVAITGNAP